MPLLPANGLSTLYVDESDNKTFYVIACVSVPTVTRTAAGLENEWSSYLDQANAWRRELKRFADIPVSKELKGSKLATGRNQYRGGCGPLYGRDAIAAYRHALASLDFLPDESIFSVWARRGYQLYGHTRLEAALYAMFQRVQRQCQAQERACLIFFDEGHDQYRTLFRKACVHLPTGSRHGRWSDGRASQNMPLTHTLKDANFKDSRSSHFIQIADLVAYATLNKAKLESGALSPKEARLGAGDLHDAIPRRVLNLRVDTSGTDGIKRLNNNGPA